VGAQLFLFLPSLEEQINLVKKNTGFIEPQLFIHLISAVVLRERFFTAMTFTLLYWLMIIAGISSLVGYFTRASTLVFALVNWIFVAHTYSYAEEHHPESILCIFLVLLAFSPSGNRLSVDAMLQRWKGCSKSTRPSGIVDTAVWPLKLVQVLLSLAYLSTGLAKILDGGSNWMNGYTLQKYILSDAVVREMPFGLWVAQQHLLCVILSIATIIFEIFFFLTLIVPWTVPYFLIAGILFHSGIYVTMAAPFLQHIFLYAVFIDFEHILNRKSSWSAVWRKLSYSKDSYGLMKDSNSATYK
jgi:uncharacterized membrane protein YphA (DoxX/SURF4 family)